MVSLTVNGVVFAYPQTGDSNWGSGATGWAQAVTSGMLSLAGGSFPLTAQVDFGASFGLKGLYFLTETANPAGSGVIRLANADGIGWRNLGNTADYSLQPVIDGFLQYNSKYLVPAATLGTSGQVLTSGGAGVVPTWTSALVNPMTTLGDLISGGASGAATRLAGDTSNVRKFLRSLSSAGVAAAPVWDTVLVTDITAGSANQLVGVNAGATANEYKTVIAGAGIAVVNGSGTLTLSTAPRPPTTQALLSGSGTYIPTFSFVVTSASATVGATYTNNAKTFTVSSTIAGATLLTAVGTGSPSASGTLTKATGTGDATITFSSVSNAPLYLLAQIQAGGGGSSGASVSGQTVGTAGGTSSFNSVTAVGGNFNITGGTGGIGTALFRIPGGNGTSSVQSGNFALSGSGGSSRMGPPTLGTIYSVSGGAGFAAQGYGAGASGPTGDLSSYGGANGAGGGEYAELIIPNPTTYSFVVGAAGAAGTGTHNGAAGAPGIILVYEYYQ